MPDITLCSNGERCPKRTGCYRFKAIPDFWQSYAAFYEARKAECDNFLQMPEVDKTPVNGVLSKEKENQ